MALGGSSGDGGAQGDHGDHRSDAAAAPAPSTVRTRREAAPTTTAPTTTTASTTTVPIAPPDDGPDPGSRENMAAPGQVIRLFDTAEGNFDVTLTQFVADATAIVAAQDPANGKAPAGSRFALVTLVATYYAGFEKRTASVFDHLDVALVGSSGRALDDAGCGVEIPGELDQFSVLGDRGTASGNLCFLLPDAEATGPIVARVEEAFCFANCDSAWFRLR